MRSLRDRAGVSEALHLAQWVGSEGATLLATIVKACRAQFLLTSGPIADQTASIGSSIRTAHDAETAGLPGALDRIAP